jgi:3-isopropylmalate/(R)-2-methylmalate dehydratase large subunit
MAKDLILHIIGEITTDGATYRAMEFAGEALAGLIMDERMTLSNMAIEAGGKNGIIEADDVTVQYVQARTDKPFEIVRSDADADYHSVREFDASKLEPTVARPNSPDCRATAREIAGEKVDRAYIGSCTGGKTSDFIAAARVLNGRQVKVDTYVVPASVEVDMNLDRVQVAGKSLRQIFLDAGCQIGPSSCAACLGGPLDTFGRANDPIRVISSTNRNFPGRMGHKQAGVFLASPLTVAASAVNGAVADCRDFVDWDVTVGAVGA